MYVDTSVWLAAVLPEKHSDAALALLGGQEPLVASDWVLAEIASATGIKVRRSELRRSHADQVVAQCRELLTWNADLLPVASKDCRVATDYVVRSHLRASDALHLAIAGRFDISVVTLDRGMAEAGQALGLGTRLLG